MEEFTNYIKAQSGMMTTLTKHMEALQLEIEKQKNIATSSYTPSSIPWPAPLEVETGDVRENFEIFKNNWNDYCNATGMNLWAPDRKEQKASIMLSAIGSKAKTKYMNFDLENDDKLSDDLMLTKIYKCLSANSNVIYDRYMFNTCDQLENELFDNYLLRIRKLVKLCAYSTTEMSNELLRDRIVVGIRNTQLKKKLMEKSDLTLDQAIDICKISEITQNRVTNMTNDELNSNVPVYKIKKSNTKTHQPSDHKTAKKCLFCGTKHIFEKGICPAIGHKCILCNYKHHYESCCRHNKKSDSKKDTRGVKEIKNDESDDDDTDDNDENVKLISKINSSSFKGNVTATLSLKFGNLWKNVECMLDTGSNSCLIGYNQFKNLMNDLNPQMLYASQGLVDFNGNPIESIGTAHIPCKRKNKKYIIVFQIIRSDHQPLLSSNVCSALKLVQYSSNVKNFPVCDNSQKIIESIKSNNIHIEKGPDQQINRVAAEHIVEKYSDIFNGYGLIPGEVDLEIDELISPVIQHARRIPVAYRTRLKEELEKLVSDGIIAKVDKHTDWVSNILIVQRNKSFRICLDPIPLNKALKRPNYQFTTIDEILPELGKVKVFSTCDAKKGFWQVKLSDSSSDLTCFWTPFGRFKWLRMPFGICSAPEIFQMKMFHLVHDLKGVEILADDLLIYGCGDTIEEATLDHNRNLENLFIRLRQNNCKLNREKLNLCKSSVKFFGHLLTSNGLQADNSKITAIKNMKSPCNKNDLEIFIGMVTYLSRYIPNLSTQFSPLRKLVLEDTLWRWGTEEEVEYNKIKNLVSDIKTLGYFDNTKPITIECDSSSTGLGAAIFQVDKVIAYASRTLTATERNYAQIEKELLAIVFACVRFDQMIVGHKCTIRTDHKPLINIFKKPLLKCPKRLQLMLMILQRYSINVEFIEGKNNVIADALSRAKYDEDIKPSSSEQEIQISKSNVREINKTDIQSKSERMIQNIKLIEYVQITDERLQNIKDETEKDTSLQKLISIIVNGWPKSIRNVPDDVKMYHKYKNELSTENGIIFKDDRILIPYSLRKLMINKVHVSHNGIEATLNLARQNIFWPGMSSEIKDKIKECDICVKYSDAQQKPPMQSHMIPTYPFQFISMDVLQVNYKDRQQKFLVTVDHYSDFFELDLLKDLTPYSTIEICKRNFSRHGLPEKVLTNGATNFICKEFSNFATSWNFVHINSAPHHQQANGKAEAAVKIAKRLIKKSNESKEDLWYALLHWRNIKNKINSSPVQRIFSRKTRTGLPSSIKSLQPKIVHDVSDQIELRRRNSKYYYDKKTRQLPHLEVGQSVAVQVHPKETGLWSKGVIEQKISDRSYLVNVNDAVYRRDRVNIKPHSSAKIDSDIAPAISEDIPFTNVQSQSSILRSPQANTNHNQNEEIQNTSISATTNLTPAMTTSSDSEIQSHLMSNENGTTTDANILPSNSTLNRPQRQTRRPAYLQDYFVNI